MKFELGALFTIAISPSAVIITTLADNRHGFITDFLLWL